MRILIAILPYFCHRMALGTFKEKKTFFTWQCPLIHVVLCLCVPCWANGFGLYATDSAGWWVEAGCNLSTARVAYYMILRLIGTRLPVCILQSVLLQGQLL
jgi:hypothetical protein